MTFVLNVTRHMCCACVGLFHMCVHCQIAVGRSAGFDMLDVVTAPMGGSIVYRKGLTKARDPHIYAGVSRTVYEHIHGCVGRRCMYHDSWCSCMCCVMMVCWLPVSHILYMSPSMLRLSGRCTRSLDMFMFDSFDVCLPHSIHIVCCLYCTTRVYFMHGHGHCRALPYVGHICSLSLSLSLSLFCCFSLCLILYGDIGHAAEVVAPRPASID